MLNIHEHDRLVNEVWNRGMEEISNSLVADKQEAERKRLQERRSDRWFQAILLLIGLVAGSALTLLFQLIFK